MALSAKTRQQNRDGLGSRLKKKREDLGYNQLALAKELGLEYHTMISQMELGYISIPPNLWSPLADALQFDKSHWILTCLEEGYPEIYRALFQDRAISEITPVLDKLRKGGFDNTEV